MNNQIGGLSCICIPKGYIIPMIKEVEKYINEQGLIKGGEKILVAFSGGPDSVFLAISLNELKYNIGLAYLNHQLRKDSMNEEEFVVDFARVNKIHLFKERGNVKETIKKKNLTLEVAAREVRREFLLKIMEREHFDLIATGHTLDDLIETFFIRLLRGSGFGLRSIPPYDYPFIRPILHLRKKDITDYLDSKGVPYYTDPTNSDRKILRNRIRGELIPLIEKMNPNAIYNIKRSIENLSEIEEAMQKIVGEMNFEVFKMHIKFPIAKYITLTEPMKFLFLKKLLAVFGYEYELKRAHIKSSNNIIELKSAIIEFEEDYGYIIKKTNLIPIGIETRGSFEFGDFKISTDIKEKKGIDFSPNIEYFDIDELELPLKVRTRKDGDCIMPFGLKGRKKLKEIFIEKRIPRFLRNLWPVIEDKRGVVFVPGVVRSERGRLNKKTRDVLIIKYERIKDE